MGTSSISFSILVLIISVLWKPAYTDKCSLACKGSATGPTFLNGHKYNYGVEGTVSIYLTGADKQETGVKLLGQATVTGVGNCVNELVVQNLAISGPDGKKYPCPEGIEKPVRFTIQDGKVGPEICSEEDDSRRSLNIKRAIISLLQTGTKPSVETDIFGACPTEASSSKEGNFLLVHRSRDLSRCAFREQGKNDLITSVANPSAEIKNSQVLQSNLNVESKVNSGIPEKVEATEEYLYKPFSVGENGARAKVNTKLTLTGKGNGAASGKCSHPRTIIFENPHGAAVDSNIHNALNAVKDTAKTLTTEASSKSAGLFAQLVRILRYTNKEDLLKVFQQVKGNNLEKRVFLDGLLRTGTGYSLEASINLLKSKQLSPLENNLVYLSLGNARHVNHEAVKAAATLLDNPQVPKEVYLGVGALAGSYCRSHNCHHEKPEGVVALSQKLASKLQNCKPKSKVEEDVVVAALKGIRNIRHLEDNLVDKVSRCANDNSVKARVRVAALEAFHADPCAAKLKNTALAILANRDLDSELRIQAYLAVIACPCAGSASKIADLLQSEPVNQVGRFITSSLRAIRNSANPDRHLAKQHYGRIGSKPFNIDDRKYSFFHELSYNVDALGVGGTLEQTVIYSQDSFLPRSATLNLTTELFGHNFNALEIGGRQGNLDRVIEHFLGPKGILRTEDPQTLYDNLKKRYEESSKKVDQSLGRGRRSIKTEVDNFDKHLKAESVPYNNELDLDIYVKLFGTDAVFLSLGDDKGFDFNKVLDQLLKAVTGGLDKIKNFKQELRAHVLFLDAELAYPTSTGLPLKLDLVGAATARVEAATNIDVRQIVKSPSNAKVDVKLVPSTDIEVAGLFLVDGNSVATGLKVVNNLHSSTGGHLIAKVLENGNGIDIQFGLPVDKQEILTASNDLVFFTAERGQKERHVQIKLDNVKPSYSGCFDQLAGVVGLTLCGELVVPFAVSGEQSHASISKFLARYPLSGPSSVKLILEKNDLRGYHLKGIYRSDHPDRRAFELLFEAEGSKNRRTHLTGELVFNEQEKSVKIDFDSPIKVIHTQAAFYNKPTELSLFLKADYDDKKYYAKAGFNVQGDQNRSVLKPYLEYLLGGGDKGPTKVAVNGEIERVKSGPKVVYNIKGIQLKSEGLNEVIDVNGQVGITDSPAKLEVDLKAKQGQQNGHIRGTLSSDTVQVEFQNTLNENFNFKLDAHHTHAQGSINSKADLVYGSDFKSQFNRVSFQQILKTYEKSQDDYSFVTKNKLEIGGLNFKVRADADIDPKKVDVELDGQYQDKKANFAVIFRKHIKNPQDYSFKLNTNVDKQGLEVFSKRDCLSDDKSNFENYVQIKNVAKYELSGVVLHKDKPNDIVKGANGHFKISGKDKTEDFKFDVGVTAKGEQYSSHAKLSSSAGEFLDYLLNINGGANPNGQLKLVIKDSVSANGQYKVNDADGKGNGAIIFDFKKSQRKIKGDFTFVAKEPVFSAEVDLFLNFEKDNNDKLHFSTNSKRTDKLFESKNKLVYAGKKSELNVHTEGVVDFTGKTRANVEVVLPTERCLTFKLDRDVTEKDNVYNGNAELLLSDAPKRGSQASSIHYKAKAHNVNLDKSIINYEGQLEFQLKDGKKLVNSFSLVNAPAGDKFKYDFKAEVTGNLLPKRASLVASGTYPDSEKVFSEDYKLKGSYGDDIGFEVIGNYDVSLFEDGKDKKYQDLYTVTLRLPFEKAHDIKYVSDVLVHGKQESGEFNVIQSLQVNADLYKLDLKGSGNPATGNAKLHVLIPHVDPFTLDTTYKHHQDGEVRSVNLDLKSQYGKGKNAEVVIDAKSSPQKFTTEVKARAPQAEKVKDFGIAFTSTNVNADTYSVDLTGHVNDKSYALHSTVGLSKSNPILDIALKNPDGTHEKLNVKGTGITSTNGKIELKLENVRGLTLDGVVEGTVNDDNINFKFVGNSDKLGLKNYKVDISSKQAGNGKRLEFQATNDNKNVLSGSTSLISKKDDKQTIYEGSGSVKVKDEQKSATFKYIRTLLTEGNEQGIETFLNLAIGDRSYVAESRVTNLEFKNSYLYCEEKKQCAHVDINSKLNLPKQGTFQHLVNVNVDLRKLGVTPEFGLEITNEVADKKLPQYTLDLHVNNKEKKYHLHVYSQPDYGKFPAGVTLALPTRTLAAETILSYPVDKALPFPVRGELAIHADKKKPQHKTAVRFLVDVSGDQQGHSAIAEVGFSHPKLGKEALIGVRGKLLTPKEKTVRIEASTVLHLASLGADRESKLLLEANPTHFKFVVDTPLVKVLDIEGSASVTEKQQQGELKFCLLAGKPVTVRAIAKEFQYYEFTTEEADRKLMLVSHLDPEKRVDISADIVLGGEKKNIIHGALFLNDNLVKSDYGFSQDNFKYFANALKNDLTTLESRVKQLGQKASNDFKDSLKKIEPKLKDLEKSYLEDFYKVYQELDQDKELAEVLHVFAVLAENLVNFIEEVVKVTKPIVDQATKTISEASKQVHDLYEKQIEPQLVKLYETLGAILKEYLEGLLDLVAHFAALISDFFEKHKAELQELTNTVAEIFKDLTRLLVAQLKELRVKAVELYKELLESVNNSPLVATLKEKYQELAVPDQILNVVLEVHNMIRAVLPSEETKNFADAVYSYVNKKLRQTKVDDAAELRIIYEKLVVALTSLLQLFRQQYGQLAVPSIANAFDSLPFISGPGQISYPGLRGAVSFSLLNTLATGDIVNPLLLLQAYRLRSFDPLDEVPRKLRAVVVNGQHIFTFDGRHLTFPGQCRYVLAHDHVDRNFTLLIQLANGLPKALILEDKSGTTIELKDNGQVLLNGNAHGFPVESKDVFAFRKPDGRIGLGSLYGLIAYCSSKLEVCYIEVSGFYLGKLRGLLGDGNNEPYDDFRLPNGKICTSEAEFGNAYRLAGSCKQVTVPEHSHHQHHQPLPESCEQVFGASSPLRPLSLFLDVAPFRQACIHAVADSKNAIKEACQIGAGYAALALSGLLPAVLPPACVKCHDADGVKEVGDVYSLKTQDKQADILVLIETTKLSEKPYKELLIPLVSQLVDTLKSKKVTDIKVHLIGATKRFPYPIVYDTDLKLKNAKVVFEDDSRYEEYKGVVTGCEKFDNLQGEALDFINSFKVLIGAYNVRFGQDAALETPLRPGAVKHIITLSGEHCRTELGSVLSGLLYGSLAKLYPLSYSYITVTEDLAAEGKTANQVVGFNREGILLLGEKKFLKGVKVTYRPDSCIDFIEVADGLVLSSTNYQALNAGQQKQYLQLAANSIASQLLQQGVSQDCVCAYADPFTARTVCSVKEKKEAARRRK
ncbi:apolipophorins isoform X2 [Amyelois transitella]|uniref:apolipophorins isoform X2 n=1 Tax=Amyelois transitella TaxID=680683 RepID=UPI00067E5EDE|nr:apolipophorins isoform X2 [Amyelois transitella]